LLFVLCRTLNKDAGKPDVLWDNQTNKWLNSHD
jgi:hypothetical protein